MAWQGDMDEMCVGSYGKGLKFDDIMAYECFLLKPSKPLFVTNDNMFIYVYIYIYLYILDCWQYIAKGLKLLKIMAQQWKG